MVLPATSGRPGPRLIVGLGNPGAEYARTRHNVGFWFVDRLAEHLGVTLKVESRFRGAVGRYGDCRLLKPDTFMNHSGQSVSALMRFFRLPAESLFVVHDELDLPPGQMRLRFGGGLAGHNGLKDIAAHLGNFDFWRLRVGIGHPGDRAAVADFVLRLPSVDETAAIDQALERALDAWPEIARGNYAEAMALTNARPSRQ